MTSLLLSHNRLLQLPPESFQNYSLIEHLDVSYNSISKVKPGVCAELAKLSWLSLEHNEVKDISSAFIRCNNMSALFLGHNRLDVDPTSNPFFLLKFLAVLDVSENGLKSAQLGVLPQLKHLRNLSVSHNSIKVVKKETLRFLVGSNLHVLNFSRNPLQTFEDGCFKDVNIEMLILDHCPLGPVGVSNLTAQLEISTLTILYLKGVGLNIVDKVTFQGLNYSKLQKLCISNNGLTTVEGSSFSWLHHLEYLDLSNNRLSTITDMMFEGLRSLQYLYLRNATEQLNIITEQTFASLAMSPLLHLDLSHMGITMLKPRAMSHFPVLRKLNLGLNKIRHNFRGSEFKGLNNISEIYLSYNPRISLSDGAFSSTPTLKHLMLSNTHLNSLYALPFNLPDLTFLDLSHNNMNNLADVTLDYLQSLKVLLLSHNNLARLWKHNNLPHGPVFFLRGLSKLEELQLQSNGFDEIPLQAFAGLSSLKSLDLSLNLLDILPDGVFSPLSSIRHLDLHKNQFTAVEPNVFASVILHLMELSLDKNPFECTCDSLSWFVEWLRNESSVKIDHLHLDYRCKTPLQYYNWSILQFDTSPCKDNAPFFQVFVVSTLVVTAFIVLGLLFHLEGWRLEYWATVLSHRMLGCDQLMPGKSVAEQNEPALRYNYDAFVVNAQKDGRWIAHNVEPLEEGGGLRLYFEGRDQVGGDFRLEAIAQAMRESRRILVVVTRSLFKDAWCRNFTVLQALHRAIEQSREAVILVFLEDIPDHELHVNLNIRAAMFPRRCILHWPQDLNQLPLFHRRLRAALGYTL
uniref:toll-like receptor 3 n=1 Tax=Myxine glutinosa TaxID=7769 RepID=UPI00358DE2DA